jgi:site-specific DNA-methyltransferase (adenine-specific)
MNRVMFSAASTHWATPGEVYGSLDREFHFDFDPCPLRNDTGPLPVVDGLVVSWRDKRVFCNPPYGPGVGRWIAKGKEARLAVYLLPARTDTAWFHDLVLPLADEIRFLRGRLKFGDAVNVAPFPSMVVIYK